MAEQVIREWLSEYKSLSAVEIHSFASSILHNHELIQAIYSIHEDRSRQHELLEPVCNQLFSFYRSHEEELKRFVLQFIPTLIAVYVSSVGQLEKRNYRSIEVLLLGIYNLEVVDPNGTPKVQAFQLPSLAQPSIYHEPMSGASVTLTENALSRLEKGDVQHINIGPFPQVETLNAQSRLRVMTILMNIYNSHLSYITKPSLHALCKCCSKLVKQGFNRQGHFQRSSYGNEASFTNIPYPRLAHRVPLSAPLLLEYLHAVYYAIYNGFSQIATQTLEDIHVRATYELYPEVLLMTNAIRSSLKLNPVGQSIDGPMGISVALSPTTSTSTISKSIVTNASFRTKKLPDDIPIQEQNSEKPLTTISEEYEDSTEKNRLPKEKSKEKVSMVQLISKKVEKVKSSARKEDPGTPANSASASGNVLKAKEKEKGNEPKKKNSDTDASASKPARRDEAAIVATAINSGKNSVPVAPNSNSKVPTENAITASKPITPTAINASKPPVQAAIHASKSGALTPTATSKGINSSANSASKGAIPSGTITSKGSATIAANVNKNAAAPTTKEAKEMSQVKDGCCSTKEKSSFHTKLTSTVMHSKVGKSMHPSIHTKSAANDANAPVIQNGDPTILNRGDSVALQSQPRSLYNRLPCNILRMEMAHLPAGGNSEPQSPLLSETDSHITDDTDNVSVESSSEIDDFSSSSSNPKREMDGNVLQGVVHTIV